MPMPMGTPGAAPMGAPANSLPRASFCMSAARDCAVTCTPPVSWSSRRSEAPPGGTATRAAAFAKTAAPGGGGGGATGTWSSAMSFRPARSKPLRCATAFLASSSSLKDTTPELAPPDSRWIDALDTVPKGEKRSLRSSCPMSWWRLETLTRDGWSCCAAMRAACLAAMFFSACEGCTTHGKPQMICPLFATAAGQLSIDSNSTYAMPLERRVWVSLMMRTSVTLPHSQKKANRSLSSALRATCAMKMVRRSRSNPSSVSLFAADRSTRPDPRLSCL
mmetsp:Transcript_31194/g.78504  ORF Transcript_31194/g.78504 Transcript_31194/m.78504 type:complete len:277 (-) Transcript_31194:63-893(-)